MVVGRGWGELHVCHIPLFDRMLEGAPCSNLRTIPQASTGGGDISSDGIDFGGRLPDSEDSTADATHLVRVKNDEDVGEFPRIR